MTYGDWLRQQREQRGLSQEKLGELAGVDGTYINKIENRRVKTPYHPLRSRIHAVFGTSDSDPELLPFLSAPDQGRALLDARNSTLTTGEKLDRVLAIATPAQREAVEAMLKGIALLLCNSQGPATIAHDASENNT